MLAYAPVAQLTGMASKQVSLTSRLPWLYIIAAVHDKVVYVGETHDNEGILMRLGSHFGPYSNSTLKRRAEERAAVTLRPPFVIITARLPFSEDPAAFDGTSKAVRRQCEAVLQQLIIERFVLKTDGWTIVSQADASSLSASAEILSACESIYDAFRSTLGFLDALSAASPFHLVVLDPYPTSTDSNASIGEMLEDIELTVFTWVLDQLRLSLGEDKWWREGIPQDTRIECQGRLESDPTNSGSPPQAYMMFMDLKAIAKKNWGICGPLFEAISLENGKEKATNWLQEVNQLRNLWAHPIRRKFAPLDPAKVSWTRELRNRCYAACRSLP